MLKRRGIMVALAVIIVAAIAVPSTLLVMARANTEPTAEAEAVIRAFQGQYGQSASVTGIVKPVETYYVFWMTEDASGLSLLADTIEGDDAQGVWVELLRRTTTQPGVESGDDEWDQASTLAEILRENPDYADLVKAGIAEGKTIEEILDELKR